MLYKFDHHMGRLGQKIKGFFGKVGRGIKKAATYVWNNRQRIGKPLVNVAKNVAPVAGKILGSVVSGSGTIGTIAKAAGAIGGVLGGKVGNWIKNGASKVEQKSSDVGTKAGKIKEVINNASTKVSTA